MAEFVDTPIGEGTKRSIITGVGTFAWTAFSTYQGFLLCNPIIGEACTMVSEVDRIKVALVAGFVAALAPFGTQMVQSGMDQRRADRGQVMASDVPVAIAARTQDRKPSAVARDFKPANLK